MTTFVLVHGAWQGGWCWKRVAAVLRRAGHEVFTPTLTGLGERAHLFDEKIDLDTHIQDVLGVIYCEELSDIILCGHSYGGVVITGVADKVPDQIHSLVYLDALVPANGQSALDLLPTKIATGLRKSAQGEGGSRVPPGSAEAFGVSIENQTWVDRRCVDHPFRSFEQPVSLKDNWKLIHRYIYIYATGWSPGIGKPFFKCFHEEKSWRVFSLPCGHDVMIDMPKDLAKILISLI
ncbi:alpha/beta hydrolase [Microbulbifer sp. A4B17]|uniref:alpha/beta hydrolase n=1 Tax=Microbulbifer sp. A4B17 TaxID=359370 RepID=UPI000D52F0FF|nr:alpha/beta hydrolase family protein [Microbulbifer sp. A4B17]AWF81990.1 alpha/beta hydrolase [Microbulbifer sp. A4B17]